MKIAIIGTGYIGGNLARIFATRGHEVTIANSRNSQALNQLAAETGASPTPIKDVAQDADVVIISIPQKNIPDLPAGFLDKAAPGAVVIDTGNYYPLLRDGLIEPIEKGLPESRWVEQQINHPVIKAFNAAVWYNLIQGVPAGTPGRLAMPVAGDDPSAKAIAMKLVEEVGFDAVDAGGLDESWRQQPGSPAYTVDLDIQGMRKALSEATLERKPGFSAIHLSAEQLKEAQQNQAEFFQSIDKAIQILMKANDWTEAEATKNLHKELFRPGKNASDVLTFVFDNERLS